MFNTEKINKALIDELTSAKVADGIAAEPEVSYGINITNLLKQKMKLIPLIENGVSSDFFFTLVDQASFSLSDWCRVIQLPYRTVQRYQKEGTMLKSIHTEKIFEFIDVIEKAEEIFGSSIKLEHWLYDPKYIFNHKRPIDMLTNSFGKEMVMAELHRIDHGIFA